MPSHLLQPVADKLAQVIRDIAVTPAFNVPSTRTGGNAWSPKALSGTGPWAVIEIPDIRRTPLDEGEVQLGGDDWYLSYDLTLYFDFKALETAQSTAVELLEEVIAAVDENAGLDIAGVDDAKVVEAVKAYDLSDKARPLLAYECEVQVHIRNPTT